ncbi:hypothetical protein NPIL_164931 [Nephila pilipes]|uniref:Uncharacterized protein n=1 Tax=Nephila pilipes TaxID=299642 RepID=A0A8X6QHD3_NEPPI|nr:hypothetical protein NPIL_164931 [Nephila pilipes]
MTQEDSPCLSRQKVQEEIQFLSILIENTAATLSAYKSRRFFDENDYAFQAELSRYRDAEARQQQLVSAFSAIPPCEYNGYPYHSEQLQISHIEINISSKNPSPTNSPQKTNKRKDENGFITPPSRKTAKINYQNLPTQSVISTQNKLQN